MIELRKAYVYICDTFAGVLSETDFGYSFVYDEVYLKLKNPKAISLTIPLRKEPYISKTLFSFFDGLIPEGWLLNVVAEIGKSILMIVLDFYLFLVKIQ